MIYFCINKKKHPLVSLVLLLLLLLQANDCLSIISFSAPTTTIKGKVGRVSAGPLQISELGIGTWQWVSGVLFFYSILLDT